MGGELIFIYVGRYSQVTETGTTDPAYDDATILGFLRQISADGDSLLHVLAASGGNQNYRECAMMINEMDETLVSECNSNGETALDCAAKAGHINMVLHLLHLERKRDRLLSDAVREKDIIKKTNGQWETQLHKAVRQRDAGELRILKQEDGDLARIPDIHGTSPLYLAISLGYSDMFEEIISTFRDVLCYDGPNGQNALHAAVLRSADLTMSVLRMYGDLRTKADYSGSTPLHFAASVGVPGTTSSLLDRDINSVWKKADNKGLCPIHIAASVGVMDPIYSLVRINSSLRDAKGRTLLHIAVENGKCNVVKFICREPTPIYKDILNMKDNDGNTALHLAVRKRDKSIFGHLLGNRDVELNHVNMDGYTPLDLASKIKVEHPFSPPQNPTEWMIRALAHSGAQFSPRRRDEFIDASNSEKKQEHGTKLAESTESVLVASALIATLTFAAAFTLPGSYKTDKLKAGTPVLGSLYGFKVFLVANIFAFYFSVAATFSLAEYGNRGNVDPLVRCAYAQRAVWLFHVALKSIIIAFALGVSVVMWEVSLSAIIIVSLATSALVLYGNVPLAHDFRLLRIMYCRFGFSRSWNLHPSTSSHLGWTSWRLTNFIATLGWNLVKLFWAYGLIFVNPTEWMIRALAHSGAHFSPYRHHELVHAKNFEEMETHGKNLSRSIERTQAAAALIDCKGLIATLTFAAAFTMPGSYRTSPKEGTPALGAHYFFKVFLVADIFAFFCTVAAIISLAEYGNRGTVDPLVRCKYAQRSVWFFHVALKSIVLQSAGAEEKRAGP
uniref:PGG domain-containing protein n=1 Tax=Leersia perrieri TaxID=77586 RepID=A0A0D9XCK0_9ORYZ